MAQARGRRSFALALIALAIGWGSAAALAQEPEPPSQTAREGEIRVFRTVGSRIAIGRSIVIERDEEVRDGIVVIGGTARVDGRVRDHILVVGGDLVLGPDADVRGDIALVGGALVRTPGSHLTGQVSNVAFGAWWPHWSVSSPFFQVDSREWWSWLGLAAITVRISILAILMLFILVVARARVARVGRAAAAAPGRALLVGLAAEILFVPLLVICSIALALTIIGIPIVALLVPLVILTAIAAMLLGFTALACRLGEGIEDRLGLRIPSAVLATAIGLFVILAPALLARVVGLASAPLGVLAFSLLMVGAFIEFIAWTMGLGATLMTGFGRWSTVPPPIPTT